MYVRLPDDYKLPAFSAEQTPTSPTVSLSDVADVEHNDSPVAEQVPQSVTDDADVPVSQAVSELHTVLEKSLKADKVLEST